MATDAAAAGIFGDSSRGASFLASATGTAAAWRCACLPGLGANDAAFIARPFMNAILGWSACLSDILPSECNPVLHTVC